jgi:hypothetical protein
MNMQLSDYYSDAAFRRRITCARTAPLDDHARRFLRDMWDRCQTCGADMYITRRQRRYLQALAVRGGWRPYNHQEAA